MSIPHKPLALVKELLESLGLDISYAYDDLVFVSHGHYLLRFTERGEELALHMSSECAPAEAETLAQTVIGAAEAKGFTMTRHEDYTLTANEADETISLAFAKAN